MPTREALARLQQAEQNMQHAVEEQRAFIERPDRTYSAGEIEQNMRLVDNRNRSIAEYLRAFEDAAKS